MLSGLLALSAGVAVRPNITVTVLGSPEGPAAPRVTNAETARAQRSKLTRDIEAVDSDVREMGKAEDEVIGQLAARAKMLERTLRERDDELKEARPRLETLEVELAAAKEEEEGQIGIIWRRMLGLLRKESKWMEESRTGAY